MIKKIQLFCLTLLSSFLVNGQTAQPVISCGTPAPPQQWEDWFSNEVEKFKQKQGANKTQQVIRTIPVIVHIIHFGEPVGTFPNIDSSQVRLQINSMTADFGGTGLNSGSIPSQFSGSAAGNTGIQFCRATKDPNGVVLQEIGIHRINAAINSWQNPNTPTLNIQDYINTVVKPFNNCLWDPTKYLNVWISDRSPTLTLNGFSTYPGGTSLTGLYGGNMTVGTNLDDGIWCWTKAFGFVGTQPPYDKGRVMTHEAGHYFGLRHIWGDGNCLSDYCADTPPAKQPNYGCPPTPSYIDRCGTGQSPNGEMTMNFMDMTNDACMSMFTAQQNIRMQTALSQCPNRNVLGTHSLCSSYSAPSSSAVPSFTVGGQPCVNVPFTPFNTSSGYPDPNFIWSSTPPAGFSPNPTVANPAITFNTPGTYTLSLVATNTVSNATFTMAVTATTCSPEYTCIDSLRIVKNIDSLKTYVIPNSTVVAGCLNGFAGYMTGTNCYNDREYAQFFPQSSYSATPYPQVNSVVVLFDAYGTKLGVNPGSKVTCKIYGGSVNYGPGGGPIGTKQDSLAYVVATTKTTSVRYIGDPNYVLTELRIIPYKFNFASPVIINNPPTGFFAGVEVPQIYAGDSIRIYNGSKYNSVNDSSAWALTYNNVWRPLKSYRSAKAHLAIIPIITCSPILGIKEKESIFNSNITVMPNPGSGLFNLVFTLPKEEEIYIRIYNSVGQEISSSHLQNVSSNVMSLDLSSKPDGIYFTEISNGMDRVVKKIILNH